MSEKTHDSTTEESLLKAKLKQRTAHRRWKDHQAKLNDIDYSALHYGQKVSGTNKL